MNGQPIKFKNNLEFETSAERSKLMSKIRSKETKTEILLRKTLWALGIRYRKNYKKLPGSPDIVISKIKLAIFVDGGLWHGQDWDISKKRIKNNQAYWIPKIERNMQRDRENNEALGLLGYKVIRFWESDIKKNLLGCVGKILNLLV